ncbi:interferon-induced very large GTPase 1 [Micropterus dolomieu]|uniref:interferon-induced very large GTPase 1 n=1 Tax=Micropterus dolomieu TaxID=147949 RepID=UPI001E8D2BC1|nr:interferon-induced very large GTPase 1 [Micropterus dolomieu]
MSFKFPKRLSSKKKKPPKDNAQAEVLNMLGLEAFLTTPLDPASMLDISTWTLDTQAPLEPKDLPNAFLQHLWLLSPDARSPFYKPPHDVLNNANKSPEEINGGDSQCAINPLDLVTAVFMSANTFLQQEMTVRMVQCQFAVPLVLQNINPVEPSHFLLWPLRGVVSQWRSHFPDKDNKVYEGHLASTDMPMISCVKLGHCGVSKSKVLNNVMSRLRAPKETFLHRGVDGGQLPRRLSNGLVEIGWYLPSGDTARDIFPVPVVISNLRGDASTHEKNLSLLCQASSAVVVFCGDLGEKEKQILASCKDMASNLILIDLSDTEQNENRVVGFVDQNLEKYMGLPRGSVLQGRALSEKELANRLCDTLKDLLPDKLKLVTLEGVAKLAEDLGLNVDEGAVCKKAMATVEKVLKGLDKGSDQFRKKQLPLQGALWSKLAEIEKEERKQIKEGKNINPQLQKEKKVILIELSSYKMTPAMKIFTDALCTTNKGERTYFLSWMKLKLQLMQTEKQNSPKDLFTNLQTEMENCMPEHSDELENAINNYLGDSLCQDFSFKHPEASCSLPFEPDLALLGLEHFLREMGLIFELTHISPGSGSQNVLRLPSLATDLLLYGIPLELMDGDASNIPIHWLGCVFAELKRRLPQKQCRVQALTNLGVHHARNAKVLSALFGVKFPEGRKRSTRGLYMAALCLPNNLRKDMECDFLLLIDAEGLCSISLHNKRNTLIHDNEMATVATGLSDVLMQNISSHAGSEFESNFTVIVNALLRIKECGSIPICQVLAQDEGINSILQATQLSRVYEMLQTETGYRGTNNSDNHYGKTTNFVKGPWYNMSLSEPVGSQYSKAVLNLKQNLFGALKRCAAKSKATGLPEFMSRLIAVWDAVTAESFSIGLQNTDKALAFSLFCTELSQWEDSFLEHMERWLMGVTEKILATKAKGLDAAIQNDLPSEFKDEVREEVKTQVDKLRSKAEAYLMKEDLLKMKTFIMSNMDDLQEQVTEEIIQRMETVNESHCYSTQLKKFETLLKKEQESKLPALIENSRSTKVLFEDTELEEEFESVWSKTLSNFDFRPSETDDITTRVTNILKENLIIRGLQKHITKLEVLGQNQTSSFQVNDEHFGYRSRLKHMFEDNNRPNKLEARQVACRIIDEYNQFVADKYSSPADFSDSYITKLLENVENALKEKPMEIRSAFEVDLKVYLCRAACQDFQKLHDRYAKDRELLTCLTATKSMYLAEFIYQFRKRDQCQRVAQAFTSMIIKSTVLDYIYRPLGMHIVEEIQSKALQYQSPRAFHLRLLEELIKEDCFESFLEYLLHYDNFRLRKIQETVVAHISESNNLGKWRQQRLGEIIGKIAAAVSQTAEGTNGVLSDAKPLLERVCLTLERDGGVDVTKAALDGPLFDITTEWDRFITCLMELLAAMRLELAKEFSQNGDITQLLQCLPIQPQESLFNRVRGCDKQCPLCRAPCELEEMGHEVHRALLHRPKGMFPHDSDSLFCISCAESMTKGNPDQSKDMHDMSVACRVLHLLYPDWSISPEDPNSQMPDVYWRYVLARFNERFAKEYKQEPAKIPEEWKKITKEEALYSLNEVFVTGQC